jgi:hypothetical protein
MKDIFHGDRIKYILDTKEIRLWNRRTTAAPPKYKSGLKEVSSQMDIAESGIHGKVSL